MWVAVGVGRRGSRAGAWLVAAAVAVPCRGGRPPPPPPPPPAAAAPAPPEDYTCCLAATPEIGCRLQGQRKPEPPRRPPTEPPAAFRRRRRPSKQACTVHRTSCTARRHVKTLQPCTGRCWIGSVVCVPTWRPNEESKLNMMARDISLYGSLSDPEHEDSKNRSSLKLKPFR